MESESPHKLDAQNIGQDSSISKNFSSPTISDYFVEDSFKISLESPYQQICYTQDQDKSNSFEGDSIFMSYILPDQAFQIRNLDTGEAIDVRDENRENYALNAAKVMNLERTKSEVEDFYRVRRQRNASL